MKAVRARIAMLLTFRVYGTYRMLAWYALPLLVPLIEWKWEPLRVFGLRPTDYLLYMDVPYVLAVGVPFLLTVWRRLINVRRCDFRVCPSCGYDLSASPFQGRCPECNFAYAHEKIQTQWKRVLTLW